MKNDFYNSALATYREYKDKKEKDIQAGLHDYCLLTSVLNKNDEVRLHSRFLYSLLNPKGEHYQGNKFLKEFLYVLPASLKGFIKPEKAVVIKEKDSIDLLIHDFNNFIIIENKLDAADQKHQITRYIQKVKELHLTDVEDITQHLAVVYLSKGRLRPSKKSKSIIGFDLVADQLVWQGIDEPKAAKKFSNLNLTNGQKIPFAAVSYSNHIEKWAESCLKIAPRGMKEAIKDYLQVLNRININKNTRNIMSLNKYTLNELSIEKEEEMYLFMVEAKKSLANYVAEKLYLEIKSILGGEDLIAIEDYRPMTPDNLKNWLTKYPSRDKYKNVACLAPNKPGFGVFFAIDYVYFKFDENNKVIYEKEFWVCDQNVRNLVLKHSGLSEFIASLKKVFN